MYGARLTHFIGGRPCPLGRESGGGGGIFFFSPGVNEAVRVNENLSTRKSTSQKVNEVGVNEAVRVNEDLSTRKSTSEKWTGSQRENVNYPEMSTRGNITMSTC